MVSPHHAASLPRDFAATYPHLRPHVRMSPCTYQESIDPSPDHTPSLPFYTPSPYTSPQPKSLQHSPPPSSAAAIYPPNGHASPLQTPHHIPRAIHQHTPQNLFISLPSPQNSALILLSLPKMTPASIDREDRRENLLLSHTKYINVHTYCSLTQERWIASNI